MKVLMNGLSWLFRPHTLIILTILLISLEYAAFFSDAATDISTQVNLKVGMMASFSVFLVYCAIQLPDGFFLRPHPSFWRIVQGLAISYLVLLVFILFQTPEVTRETFLTVVDPSLGVRLPEKHYAEDCRVYTPESPISKFANIYDKIDVFVPAHFIGWFMKALIYRDFYFSWFMSVLFELQELSLKHVLPNFAECWWDHLLFDILLCNGLGILAGHFFLNYVESSQYNWAGFSQSESRSPLKTACSHFVPDITTFRWGALQSPQRFIGLLFLAIVVSLFVLTKGLNFGT